MFNKKKKKRDLDEAYIALHHILLKNRKTMDGLIFHDVAAYEKVKNRQDGKHAGTILVDDLGLRKKKKKRNDEFDALASLINSYNVYNRLIFDQKGRFVGMGVSKKKFNIDNYPGKYVMYCENQEELFKFYDYLHSVGRKWCRGSSYKEFRPTETVDGRATRYIYFNNGLHGATCDHLYIVLNFKDFDWSDFGMKEIKFKVGDKVKVKEGLVPGQYYNHTYFASEMLKFRGKVGVITAVNSAGSYDLDITGYRWNWSDSMLELVESAPFTKADLKTGMVVEFRDGLRYMLINKRAYGKHHWSDFNRYHRDDLTSTIIRDNDVMKVYSVNDNVTGNIHSLFEDNNLELLWERKEEVKEMTVSEIEEKLGYKVKVIADKE